MGSQELLRQFDSPSCVQECTKSFPDDVISLLTQMSPEEEVKGHEKCAMLEQCSRGRDSSEDDVPLSQWELEKWMEEGNALGPFNGNATKQASGGDFLSSGNLNILQSTNHQSNGANKGRKSHDELEDRMKVNNVSDSPVSCSKGGIKDDVLGPERGLRGCEEVPTSYTCYTAARKWPLSSDNGSTEGGDGCHPEPVKHIIDLSSAIGTQADVVPAHHLVPPKMNTAMAIGTGGSKPHLAEATNRHHSRHLEGSLPARINNADSMHCSVCGMELKGVSDEAFALHFKHCSSRLEGSFAGNLMQATEVTLSLKQFLQVGLLTH